MNGGQVINTGSASRQYGILLHTGGSVLNSGVISGTDSGIYVGVRSSGYNDPGTFTATVTNSDTGIITSAVDYGIELAGGGSVQNAGLITDGIRLGGVGSVTNTGIVSADVSADDAGDLAGGILLGYGLPESHDKISRKRRFVGTSLEMIDAKM